MGTDIHEYVEFITKDPDGTEYVSYVGGFDLGRDYTLFGLMAGVRGGGDRPVATPKGIPTTVSYQVTAAYSLIVAPDLDPRANHEGCCSVSNAQRWIAEGSSVVLKGMPEQPERISHPDWHSASWLTAAELKEVSRRYRSIHSSVPYIGLDALIAAMEVFDTVGQSRLVFWFDN